MATVSCGWSKCPQKGKHRASSHKTIQLHKKYASAEGRSSTGPYDDVDHLRSDFTSSQEVIDREEMLAEFDEITSDLIDSINSIRPNYEANSTVGDGSWSYKFNIAEYRFQEFSEVSEDDWTPEQRDLMEEVSDLQDYLDPDSITEESVRELSEKSDAICREHIDGFDDMDDPIHDLKAYVTNDRTRRLFNYGVFQNSRRGRYSTSDEKMAGGISTTLAMQAYMTAKTGQMMLRNKTGAGQYPERIKNSGLVGLGQSQYNIIEEDFSYYDRTDYNAVMNESVDKYLFTGVSDLKKEGDDYVTESDRYFLTDSEEMRRRIDEDQQMYLVTVFPDNELRSTMERYGIENVHVGEMVNGREVGLTYTVMQPNGHTRTFVMYERRNYDSIIINGMEDYSGEGVPYAIDSKYGFFAEHQNGDYRQAAESLAFYLKEAQQGTLSDDVSLHKNGPRIDWNSILAEKMPDTFGAWLKNENPEEYDRITRKNKTDDEILDDLDFDIWD